VVSGDYPELGPYSSTPGYEGLLDAATAALANFFHGSIISDFSEN
jgi:hypothetical protein